MSNFLTSPKFLANRARLEAIREAVSTRLLSSTFTHFPGAENRAVTGIRWNVTGARVFLMVYWQPVHDTFEALPDQAYGIWPNSTEVSAWEEYLEITPGAQQEAGQAIDALENEPSYVSRKQSEHDNAFQVLRGNRSRVEAQDQVRGGYEQMIDAEMARDPEQALAIRDAGDSPLE